MWHDHPFRQIKKAIKRVVRVEIGRRGGRGWTNLEKGGVGNAGRGLYKIGGYEPSANMDFLMFFNVFRGYRIGTLSKIS